MLIGKTKGDWVGVWLGDPLPKQTKKKDKHILVFRLDSFLNHKSLVPSKKEAQAYSRNGAGGALVRSWNSFHARAYINMGMSFYLASL